MMNSPDLIEALQALAVDKGISAGADVVVIAAPYDPETRSA